jgi:hypothetical protein
MLNGREDWYNSQAWERSFHSRNVPNLHSWYLLKVKEGLLSIAGISHLRPDSGKPSIGLPSQLKACFFSTEVVPYTFQ